MDLNRVMLIGRLTRNPEMRTTPRGNSVANMTVATGRVWTDSTGAKQEKTEFNNCVLWGRLAEIASQYLTKGRRVYVEGRLETRDWTGNDNIKRYRTEIIVSNMIMLDAPKSASPAPAAPAPKQESEELPVVDIDAPEEEIKVEDIPF